MDWKENKQLEKNHHFLQSLYHAVMGIVTVYKEERNMRYHTALGIIPLVLAYWYQVTTVEWLMILLCIFCVVIMEFVNTIVENIVDLLVEHQYHVLAKKAKDIAAGAVLVAAVFALIVAAIIFLPKMF